MAAGRQLAPLLAACLLAGCAVSMVVVSLSRASEPVALAQAVPGWSKSAAAQDMQSYYAELDNQVKQSKKLAQNHLKQESMMLHHDSSADAKQHHGREGDKAARQNLAKWYDNQQDKIEKKSRAHSAVRDRAEPHKMSARAAAADLDSFFDSLATPTNKDKKYAKLANEVKSLTKDLTEIAQPIKDLKGSEEHTQAEIKDLDSVNQHLLSDSKRRGNDAARAEAAAKLAAEKAEEAAKAKKPNLYVKTKEEVTPEHIPNPKIKVYGLPPGWQAYMDRGTKHAYFFNEHSGASSWVSPKGARVVDKGLPKGWKELKDSKTGKNYFTNLATGHSTWHRPFSPPSTPE